MDSLKAAKDIMEDIEERYHSSDYCIDYELSNAGKAIAYALISLCERFDRAIADAAAQPQKIDYTELLKRR